MGKLVTYILMFLIGFFGLSLVIDNPDVILFKSYILFGGVVVSAILLMIDTVRGER
jgi:hypothetical protein